MNVKNLIKLLQHQRDGLNQRIKFLRKSGGRLKDLPEAAMFGGSLDFDNLPHDQVINVVRAFGGKWKKTKNTAVEGRVDYEQDLGPIKVRCWAGQPPPSCRLVEIYEDVPEQVIPAKPAEVIPAHKVKKFKMVCTGQGEPMVEAIGRAISDTQNAPAS